MHIHRTLIKKEIVCEYILPERKSRKVVILAPGAPGYPKQPKLMIFLSKIGYTVFLLRYRGSFESGGEFLKYEPTKDIVDVIDSLETGWMDAWSGEKHYVKNPSVYLIGGSFGGPAMLLASNHPKVKKVIVSAPVIDWREDSEIEPMDKLKMFMRRGFYMGYRFSEKNWQKLCKGNFYNPIQKMKQMKGSKILIIHGVKDQIVPFSTSQLFAKVTGAKLIPVRTSDHLGLSKLMRKNTWKEVKKYM